MNHRPFNPPLAIPFQPLRFSLSPFGYLKLRSASFFLNSFSVPCVNCEVVQFIYFSKATPSLVLGRLSHPFPFSHTFFGHPNSPHPSRLPSFSPLAFALQRSPFFFFSTSMFFHFSPVCPGSSGACEPLGFLSPPIADTPLHFRPVKPPWAAPQRVQRAIWPFWPFALYPPSPSCFTFFPGPRLRPPRRHFLFPLFRLARPLVVHPPFPAIFFSPPPSPFLWLRPPSWVLPPLFFVVLGTTQSLPPSPSPFQPKPAFFFFFFLSGQMLPEDAVAANAPLV